MGVDLYFSNQLMSLAHKLHENLAPVSIQGNILDPPVVIVPNMNLSKWIKLTLARKTGIFMNVEFQYLETGLWKMIRSIDPTPGPGPQLMDKDGLKIILFFILMAQDREIPELTPLNTYLQLTAGNARSDIEIRCWQLSEELARLFQEYEYHRSDMVQRWLSDAQRGDAMEICQRWVYRTMCSLKDQLERSTGQPLRSVAEYARDILLPAAVGKTSDRRLLSRVHFFGLSQISPLHLQLLSQLEPFFDIRIYSLNPSREYWEDVKTPFEKRWIERKQVSSLKLSQEEWSAGDLFSPVDHALLSAWGKPGRESIRLLCQLTDYDFHAGFIEIPQPNTVLAAIGHGLLTLEEQRQSPATLAQDTSLQIAACPGLRREVETVYNNILYNLETNPDLCMTDIAVMVSDMSRYKPVVDSVFSRQPARITYNLVDSSARMESIFAQAVLAMMDLSRGTFSRKEVFALLRNPCVMQRWGYGPEALRVWIGWAEALGIFHGYENKAAPAGLTPSGGLFSWRQGLERIRISRIMTPPATAAGAPRPHFEGVVPFSDINTGDDRLIEKFCLLVESLHQAVGSLRMASASAQQWRDAFFKVVDQFIEISAEMRGEEAVFQSLSGAFDHFVDYDALGRIEPGRPLTAEALWLFVQSHLEGISGGQGDYLTGGVTVSALMPMRPIPFRVVYVLGLEEGRFPGRVHDSLLDLRGRKRRIGDINPAERNRYLFLEILLSVHDKLYLSYVSRDLQKDRDLAPCSVVLQLQRYLEQQVLGGQPFKVSQIPIKADSAAYLEPEAINDWSDVMVNRSLVQRLSCYRRSGWWPAFMDQATPLDVKTTARYCPDFAFPDPPLDPAPDEAVSLTIGLLRRFLLDPVEAVGRYHLGIGEQIDPTAELAEREDEPLSSSFPVDFEIRTAPLQSWLAAQLNGSFSQPSMARLETEFESVYADLFRKSRLPAGAFAVHDKSKLKQQVLAVGEKLDPFVEQMRTAHCLFSAVWVGAVMDDVVDTGGDQLSFNPVSIDRPGTGVRGAAASIHLSGGMPWVWQAIDGAWHCLVVTGSNRRSRFADKYAIGPLLTLLAIAAGGEPCPWSDTNRMTVHVVYREHVLNLDYTVDPKRSTDYLAGLVGDFFSPPPPVWLPFETIVGDPGMRAYIGQDRVEDVDREAFFESLSATMQAAEDVRSELTGAVVTTDILDRARRRFRVFLP
ncbi:exodeoxyribonuclease V subunit gamma [Desulfosarcina sp.]|uniref:exodeoxyribonuclease V subunit gamma n=1 Tax=Desulfosarcina sp. TaxID=2027861 RepID=UPI0035681C02